VVLEKDGEDQLRRVIEGKIEGRTEVTERPGPGLKKKSDSLARANQLKIFALNWKD
jgi:hypothetical protein